MEDTLRACEDGGTGRTAKVLILVLMEDTLRAKNPLETKNL